MVALPAPRRASPRLSESEVQAEVRKAIGQLPDVRVWRNNTGQLKDSTGRAVRYGLVNGGSDLLCVVAPRGRWLVLECKPEGWKPAKSGGRFTHEQEQRDFIGVIRSMGGVGGFVRSVEEAMELVEEARG